jgi:hypothetical protein
MLRVQGFKLPATELVEVRVTGFKCSVVQVFNAARSNVQMFDCSNVLLFYFSNVLLFNCSMLRVSGSMLLFNFSVIRSFNFQIIYFK